MTNESIYRCPHCHVLVKRNSKKAWIMSWCNNTNKTVRLMRMKP